LKSNAQFFSLEIEISGTYVSEPISPVSGRPEIIELSPSSTTRNLPWPDGSKVAASAIGLKGKAIRLFVSDNSAKGIFARTEQPGWASFPKTRTEGEYPAVLSICDSLGVQEFYLPALTAAFPKIQIFPNNQILVVASRCQRFRDGSHELNAKTYDTAGNLQREFLLGDGIEHVQVDPAGKIWVGYFDEGVYGNYGWGHGDSRLGSAGLSCFDDKGTKLWDYQPPSGVDAISDCYALNVSKDGVWAHYYTNFPFVRIDSNWRVQAWKTLMGGGREFAVHGEQVLLFGGYGESKTSCKLLRLGDDTAEVIAHVSLLLPGDVDLSQATIIGRDNALHVLSAGDWYSFSMKSLS
jgi:hypothetical protein